MTAFRVRPVLKMLTATTLAALASISLASPIGYLQINGRITVQADGAAAPVQISQNGYTVFSNDRIETIQGTAALVLNGGGVVGLSEGSSARVQLTEGSKDLSLALDEGSVAYSIPAGSKDFTISVDGVHFAAMQSGGLVEGSGNPTGEVAGTLSIGENRQVSALARAGDIRVLRANGPSAVASAAPSAAVTQSSAVNVNQAVAMQSFDTLANVSQGNGVQVQTAGDVSTASVALMSGSSAQAATTAAAGTLSASGATVEKGQVALVGSTQGNTLVVAGEKDDEGIQSVSP